MADRSKDVGYALTEIRTVLSRAKTARLALMSPWADEEERKYAWIDGKHVMIDSGHRDPDIAEMIEVLEAFIAAADKWQRKGR